jgi:hypothetical protein
MNTAGWLDVWHMVLVIVARQPPFAQIMFATGAVFVAVMALEGLRTSLLAIRRAHKPTPPLVLAPAEAVALAMPAVAPFAKIYSPRASHAASRRPKLLTLSPRQFRSPRPTIRRHPMLQFAAASDGAVYDTGDTHQV